MAPHHPLFGHLLLANDLLSKLPRDAHPYYVPGLIRQAIPDVGQVFYLDMWPFNPPMLVVSSPSVFTQEHSLCKSPEVHRWIKPMANNQDLVSLEGHSWEHWRNIYNPGFSASHLIHLVPEMLKEVSVFRNILKQHAQSGVMLPLEEVTVNLTMDIIGRIVLQVLDHVSSQITDSTGEPISTRKGQGTNLSPHSVHKYRGTCTAPKCILLSGGTLFALSFSGIMSEPWIVT